MTLGFLFGSENFCKLLCVSWEVFVLHGYDWIHLCGQVLHHDCISVIVSRTTTSTENFVICCNQVTKIFCTKYRSANASSARCPCNFGPLTDLAISVFTKMSIHTVLTQILTSLGWWEELACESLRSGTLLSTRFSLNSCSHSSMSEFNRSLRSFSWSSFYLVLDFGLLGQQVSPFFPFNMFLWHGYGIRIYPTQVSPYSSSIAWHCWRCRGWWGRRPWGRRWMIDFLSWRCHGCWRGKVGGRTRWQTKNHDQNEVLCVALYLNFVFNEMWFLTVAESTTNSLSSGLRADAGRHQFSEGEKNAVSLFSYNFRILWPASTLLHGHIALAILSLPETDPQILELWGLHWWGSPGQM